MFESLQQETHQKTIHYIRSANLLEDPVLNQIEGVEYDVYQDPLGGLYHQKKQDATPAELDEFFSGVTESLSRAIRPKPILISFGHRFPLPSKLYNKIPLIEEVCKALHTPVVYSDQEEAFGVGSINPIAADIVVNYLRGELGQTLDAAPYLFTFSLSASSWGKLLERQFAL